MKKIKLVGLVGILTLSLFTTTKAFAEAVPTDKDNNVIQSTEAEIISTEIDNSTSQSTETISTDKENSTTQSTEASNISHSEKVADSSTNEEPPVDTLPPLESKKTDSVMVPYTLSIVEIDLSSEITAFYEKGDKIGALGFQVGIETSLNKKLTNYRFETGTDFIADTVGVHLTKVLADLDENTTYSITCAYSVQNNFKSIPAPELSYDAENHVLYGKTLPQYNISFYKVGTSNGEAITEISTVADEYGNFSISADNFERGCLMAAIVSSPDGLEFSEATQFAIPVEDITQLTTEPTNSSNTQSTVNTIDSAKPNLSNGGDLPSTGEETNNTLKTSGVLAIFAVFGMFFVKKRKVNE